MEAASSSPMLPVFLLPVILSPLTAPLLFNLHYFTLYVNICILIKPGIPVVLQYIDMVKAACYKRTEKKWVSMKEDEKIYTGSLLSQDLNAERKKHSLSQLPEINPCRGGTSTLARKDKSWSNVFDFFRKLFK